MIDLISKAIDASELQGHFANADLARLAQSSEFREAVKSQMEKLYTDQVFMKQIAEILIKKHCYTGGGIDDHDKWTAFVEDWQQTHGESLTRVSELVELALKAEVIEEGRTSRGTQTALGKALAKMADRIYCGKKIHRGTVVAGIQFWKLVNKSE